MKKLTAILLALVFTLSLSAPVLAVSGLEITGAGNGNTRLTYTVNSSYTVVIPPSVDLTSTKTAEVRIVSNPVIGAANRISVTITAATNYDDTNSKFRMVCGTNYIDYTIINGDIPVIKGSAFLYQNAGATADAVVTLTFTPDAVKYAGTYSDQLTFTVAEVPQET